MLFYLNRLKNLRYLSIRMMSKLDRAYKSISEVAEILNLKNKVSTNTYKGIIFNLKMLIKNSTKI